MPSASITIKRPAADVFKFICTDHFTNHPRWDPSIVAVEGVSGPARRGTRATLIRKAGPRRIREQCEVNAFDPPRSSTFTSQSGPMTIVVHTTIEELSPSSARATLSAEIAARGPAKLMAPLMRRNIARHLQRSMGTIRDLLEVQDGAEHSG